MADTISKHIDMTTGSLWRNIPLFAFPETSCQGLFNQIHKKATKKVPEADFSS